MRTFITLSSLGLAVALSGAALANPVDRSALLEHTGYANQHMQIHYWHKRYPHDRYGRPDRLHDRLYGHRQTHSRGTGPSERPSVGTGRPEMRQPAVRPEAPVWRERIVRQRPQIL